MWYGTSLHCGANLDPVERLSALWGKSVHCGQFGMGDIYGF